MRALALAALLSAACTASDPCAGHGGACIGVDVEGAGVTSVDQLRFTIAVSGLAQPLMATTPPSPGPTISLPGSTAIYLDASVAGAATLSAEGWLGGTRVGAGATPLTVVAGAHERVTVTLRSFASDGGADFAGEDLAVPNVDLAGVDLAGADFAHPPIDLAGLDLGAAPACPTPSVFCDNFEGETGSFAPWNGSTNTPNSTFGLDNTHPFLSGSTSFEVSSTGGIFALHKTLATQTGTLAVRFYVYNSGALDDTTTLLAFLNPDNTVAFSVAGGFDVTLTSNNHWKLHSTTDFFGPAIALNAWQCVELDVDLTQWTMQLYVTDAITPDRGALPVVTGTIATGSAPGPFYLGVYTIPSTGKADIWFDDVAVANQHIGCE
jgi:hypothetical protein